MPFVIDKDINRKTVVLPCVHFNTAQSVLGQNKHHVPMLMCPLRGRRNWGQTLKKGITRDLCNTATLSTAIHHIVHLCTKHQAESGECSSSCSYSSIFFLCNKHQFWDPWRVEGGNVTIFTLHRTFPHSCFYLPQVAGLSLYIFSYLSITTYCLLRRSNAQHAYSCTVC